MGCGGNFQIASPNSITASSSTPYFGNVGHCPTQKKKIKCHVKPIRSSYFSNDTYLLGGASFTLSTTSFPPPGIELQQLRTQLEWTHILGPTLTTINKAISHESEQEGQ